jgi:hypothetical protein
MLYSVVWSSVNVKNVGKNVRLFAETIVVELAGYRAGVGTLKSLKNGWIKSGLAY